ncbi:MAG: cob(I)yrinic acid a,c-diamide adenosyltransferase [Armatimonadota bacterium]|nr:cob(I)yrinic acid a,c-diamide adenosyltransferase [Armatimonadota bacterium]
MNTYQTDKRPFERGLVHVYTGDGKGKTTAALGTALRALGWGIRVCVVQFIKGYPDIGEARFAAEFGERFVLKQFAIDPCRAIDEAKVRQRKEAAEAAMAFAEQVVLSGEYGLVILDEINNAMHYRLIDVDRVLNLIKRKPAEVELILTGRNAPQAIIDAADYATEMRLLKHPFQQGISARKGIDY